MADGGDAVRGYAQAIFQIAEAEGALEAVEDELFRFAKALESEDRLRDALSDPVLPAERKKAVLAKVLGGRANPHTVSILGFLVEQGRGRELARIIEELARVAAARRNRAVAEVRTAVPLSDEQRERLSAALSKATGKTVELKVLVDPAVIGGVLARVGDQVIDGTVRRRLELARERLGGV
ncbi:MAG TPA: ATP synthase F1 subunit delta [Actinomycetota bacterium]|nr:ATP synthase F1 subunit delta [Actinomycetota bacterium]